MSRSEVIISGQEILYPLVVHPDVLLALTSEAYNAYRHLLVPGGVVIYDSDQVRAPGGPGEYGFPVIRTARDSNCARGVNMLALGVLVALTGVVEENGVEKAIEKNFSDKIVGENLRLFHKGLKMGKVINR